MPTPPRRWTQRLEGFRAGAHDAADEADTELDAAQKCIVEARKLIRSDPDLADRLVGDALTAISRAIARQERIKRLMVEARYGSD